MEGIPTIYAGVQFRSRLEAKWAAFFDLIGWRWEYEPFDLAGWIPDFLLIGASSVLVEVKPVLKFPAFMADRITPLVDLAQFEILILGCMCPIEDHASPYGPQLGWLREGSDFGWDLDWDDAAIVAYPDGRVGFIHGTGYYRDRIHGEHEQDHPSFDDSLSADDVRTIWRQASNVVQWKGAQNP